MQQIRTHANLRVAARQALIDAGKSIAVEVEPLKDQFVPNGLEPTFMEDLNGAVRNLEAILGQVSSRANRAAPSASSTRRWIQH